jgi:hypothetical protein
LGDGARQEQSRQVELLSGMLDVQVKKSDGSVRPVKSHQAEYK